MCLSDKSEKILFHLFRLDVNRRWLSKHFDIGKVPLVFVCEREVSRIVNMFTVDLSI